MNTINSARSAFFDVRGTSGSTLAIENVYIEDTVLGSSSNVFNYGFFRNISFTNISTLRLHSRNEGDNYIIKSAYSNQGSFTDGNQVYSHILLEDSTVPILSVSKSDESPESSQTMEIKNITYKNSYIDFGFDFLKIFQISTAGEYSIMMGNLIFKNLTFKEPANLLRFQQQLQSPLTISGIEVTDVTNAGILVQFLADNELYNKTHVSITNMVVSKVDGQDRSFFNINEGADIEIVDSQFSFISNLRQGAVMSAGYQKAIALFRNCSFWNNTSIEGGVFATENESNIKCYN